MWGDDNQYEKYLVKEGNGYVLKTNTDAKLIFSDPRYDYKDKEVGYINPDPVATDVSKMKVKKEWENDLDTRTESKASLYITKDGDDYGIIGTKIDETTGEEIEAVQRIEVSADNFRIESFVRMVSFLSIASNELSLESIASKYFLTSSNCPSILDNVFRASSSLTS